jgi:CRP-like cAMP-binding protein
MPSSIRLASRAESCDSRAPQLCSPREPGQTASSTSSRGGVKLSVLSPRGKEAIVAMLVPGDFFGEGCLAGQPLRMGTAAPLVPTSVLQIHKREMMRTLHEQSALSDRIYRAHTRPKYPDRGAPRRSALQFEREAAGANAASPGALRRRPHSPTHTAEDLPGDARRDGRHYPVAGERVHEQIPKTGLHQIQRHSDDQQLPVSVVLHD